MKGVTLGESNQWEFAYYSEKFHVPKENIDQFKKQIRYAYLEGLAWVFAYYYEGVPSWDWYYPYHYAPLALDLIGAEDAEFTFEMGAPYNPIEQLMSVLPRQSSHALPKCLRPLLSDPDSEIIDMYPIDFKLDVNGNRFAWMGVNLLPFPDGERLLAAVRKHESKFNEEEKIRNQRGKEQILVSTTEYEVLLTSVKDSYKDESKSFDVTNKGILQIGGKLQGFKQAPTLEQAIKLPNELLTINKITFNKCLVMQFESRPCTNHICNLLQGVTQQPREIQEHEIQFGDRRQFLTERSM